MMSNNKQRGLSPNEIEYILDFIKPFKNIPQDTANSIVINHKNKLKKQLVIQKLYVDNIQSDIDILKSEIKRYYFTSMIEPGKSVGVIAAQSIGERNTQNTLNSFHSCGIVEKTVVTGVPRFEELLNTTHKPKGKCCTVYFTKNNKDVRKLRKMISHHIVEINFQILSTSVMVNMNKKHEQWYDSFASLYDDKFLQYKHCITFTLKKDMMYHFSITMEMIKEVVEEHDDLYCVFSPFEQAQIDIFVDTSRIELSENILYITDENKEFIYLDDVVKQELMNNSGNKNNYNLFGIEGIKGIFYVKKGKEWIIETEGSNFKELLALPFVDATRTSSNNIWDIYETFGIYATKIVLKNEIMELMGGVNECHIKLLVDKMTYTGNITSISRYAMKKDDNGPMSKASFEQTLENFLNAAIYSEKETTKGVSASIICGKRPRIGTGLCDLVMDMEKVLKI